MKVVFLILVLNWPGTYYQRITHEMPSMEECLKAVAAAKLQIPHGSEQEHAGAIYCAYDKGERQ